MTTATAIHACWSCGGHRTLGESAGEFPRAGLAAGERLWYAPDLR